MHIFHTKTIHYKYRFKSIPEIYVVPSTTYKSHHNILPSQMNNLNYCRRCKYQEQTPRRTKTGIVLFIIISFTHRKWYTTGFKNTHTA